MSPLVRRILTQRIESTGSVITFAHTMGVKPDDVLPGDVILGPLDGETPPAPAPPPADDAASEARIWGTSDNPMTRAEFDAATGSGPAGSSPAASFPTPGDNAAAALAIVSGSVREALPQITALDGRDAQLLDAIEAAERARGEQSGEVRKTILAAVAQQRGQLPRTDSGADGAD